MVAYVAVAANAYAFIITRAAQSIIPSGVVSIRPVQRHSRDHLR